MTALLIRSGRRVAWLALGHPVAGLATGLGLGVGAQLRWPVRRTIVGAVVLDLVVGLLAARSSRSPARLLTLWATACRFRRRWPSLLMRSGLSGDRLLSLTDSAAVLEQSDTTSSRPRSPSLRLLPRLTLPGTVSWELDPGPDSASLVADADDLATVDGRILRATVAQGPAVPTLVVEFADDRPGHSPEQNRERHVTTRMEG